MKSSKSSSQPLPTAFSVETVLNKPWKKVLVAMLLTATVVGGSGFAYIWFTPSLKSYFFDPKVYNSSQNSNRIVLSDTEKKLLQFNPTELLIKKKDIKDLPIYPDAWKKEYFTPDELKDPNQSGPDADYDRDGLSNKQEYLYGSNPKNNNTLGAEGTDGEYVKAGRNPLSGLPLENYDFSYYFLNSDLAVLEEMNKNFDTLEGEGISIPKIYEESRVKDFSDELKGIKLTVIDNPTREGTVDYLNQRLLIMQDVVKSNYVSNLSKIYQIDKVEDLNSMKAQNQGRVLTLGSLGVPKQEVKMHTNLVYFFQQLGKLIDLRIEVLQKGVPKSEYKQAQQDIILRTVWAYRQINDAVNTANPDL